MGECTCTWCECCLDGKCNYIPWCLDHYGCVGDMTELCDEVLEHEVLMILPPGYSSTVTLNDIKEVTYG